ncbi:SPRY domain-containing protein [Vallitalea guaymasensis]|uniref:Uncharacterized protein n=1 Tax=Vallitalea guaymasensis TaxID=1185412 RepID=A0A8J8MD47_9FIRM|nr:hypothetical protein [Vallitalea guaymasensis]QUH30854.1 hypothetical protein HYG85_18800 [Vallitalea guaymasensis]
MLLVIIKELISIKDNVSRGTKVRKKEENSLNGTKLERGDTTAIIIAALTTVLPFGLGIFLIYLIFIKILFKI